MGQKATILIVDKEKILVDLLVRALTSPDLSVFGTTSADEGARLVALHGPDLLVIDPSIQNGLPLMSSMRSGQFQAKIVVVAGNDESREQLKTLNVETIVDRNQGWEALNQIMSRDPHPNVIMLTALADREIARQAMKIGAFDYILKPFDFAVIETSIAACLSYSEYQKRPWWKRLTLG